MVKELAFFDKRALGKLYKLIETSGQYIILLQLKHMKLHNIRL